MTKIKQRNELSIFEDFRIKQKINVVKHKVPEEKDLKKLNVLYRTFDGIVYYWKNIKGTLLQSNKYGELIEVGDEGYDIDGDDVKPKKSSLKKYDGNVRVVTNEYNIPISYWEKSENGNLVEVNNAKKADALSIEQEVKAWVRNKAIDAVGLEIRSMKKKVYEYSKEELMNMIQDEENKLIKKGGWKALKVAALSSLGLSWLPFI
jgi:hypothetical protein